MNQLAKSIGYFVISAFLIGVPVLVGYRLGNVGRLELLTLIGVMIVIVELGVLYITLKEGDTK